MKLKPVRMDRKITPEDIEEFKARCRQLAAAPKPTHEEIVASWAPVIEKIKAARARILGKRM